MLPRPRRTALRHPEQLEDRVTPAVGDFLRTLANPAPALADQFGTSVSIDGNFVAVGAPFDDPGGVTDAGSVYVFNLTTGGLVATIPNPSPGAGDRFGFAVAVNESQDYVWVGAPYDDPGGVVDSGTAYAFSLGGTLNATANNPSPAAGDEFGYALATHRSESIVAVGAPGDDFGATDAGRAYMFHSATGTLFNFGAGVASNPAPAAGDRFGSAVGLSPLYDMIVGAPFDDPGGVTDAGAVYLYNPDALGVILTVANPLPAAGDRFGWALEGGRSSYQTVVGAPFDDPGGVTDAGSAFVINMDPSGEDPGELIQILDNPSPAAGDQFGSAVSYRGSVAVVGAPGDDPGGLTDAGAAYAFRAVTGVLIATLADPTPAAGDKFGAAVAQTSDVAVVGAAFTDAAAADAGASHLYSVNSPPTVRNDAAVVARNAAAAPLVALGTDTILPDFGETLSITAVTQGTSGGTVALSGGTVVNYTPPTNFTGTDTFTYTVSDGKGLTTVGTVTVTVGPDRPAAPAVTVPGTGGTGYAVAASGTRAVASSAGGVLLIDTTTGATVATLTPPAGAGIGFGQSVAISADLIVVGDYAASIGPGPGAAHVYSPAGVFLRSLVAPASPTPKLFGWSVAVSGTTVAVGSWEDSGAHVNGPGRVHLFDGATGTLLRTVNNPTPAAPREEGFGYAVALSGNTLVVGAPTEGDLGTGQAYVFDTSTGSLLHTLTSPLGLTNAGFGGAVAVGGGWIVVGAREGAYVYNAATGTRVAVLGDPTFTTTDNFGAAVAVAGNRVVVGAFQDDAGAADAGAADAGAAYLFDAPTGTYLGALANPSPTATDYFGYAVAVAGNRAVVGAYQDDPAGAPNGGTTYVFDLNFTPTAGADTLTVAEDSGATVAAVLTNDTAAPDTGETLAVTAVTQPATGGSVALTGGVVRFTPAANFNGLTSFTYTVSDGNGGTATATVSVTVTPVNDLPTAVNDTLTVAEDSGATVVAVLPNDSSAPDTGETLTVTAVTQPAAGTGAVTLTGGVVRYTPPANYNGSTSFTYTVSDGNGGTATGTVSVTVAPVNDNPTVVNDTLTVAEDSGATIATVLTNDSGAPDAGETLTVSSVTQPATGGSVTLTGGVVRFTPAADFSGSTSFTYTASDGNGGTATGTVAVTVTPVNDNPTVVNDTFTVAEDAAATAADVLANDGSAPDAGEALAVTAVTPAAHGTVALAGGVVTYTPAPDYSGPDSFTYTVSDGNGGSATATVLVTVSPVNDAPAAAADTPAVAEDAGATVIDVLANDTSAPDAGETLTVTAVSQPSHGAVTLVGGVVRYTPVADYNGPDAFTYTLTDGNGGTASATVSVTVAAVNDPPTAGNDTLAVAEDAGATAVAVLANDTFAPDAGEALVVASVTQPAHGTVTLVGGVVRYAPAADYNGPDSFTYALSDVSGGTATGTVTVTVTAVNDPPTAAADAYAVGLEAMTLPVLTNDTAAPDGGETLTVVAVTQPAGGTAAVAPGGAGVVFTPATGFVGTATFTYTVSDGTSTATASVVVTLLAPTGAVKPVAVGGAPDGSVRLVAPGGTTVVAPFGAPGTPTRTATGDVDGDGGGRRGGRDRPRHPAAGRGAERGGRVAPGGAVRPVRGRLPRRRVRRAR